MATALRCDRGQVGAKHTGPRSGPDGHARYRSGSYVSRHTPWSTLVKIALRYEVHLSLDRRILYRLC